MNEVEVFQAEAQLPDKLEDLTQFVLVGKARLNAYMIKLQMVNRLSVAQEIRDQTLKEAQEVSTALIAAEQRIGEILLSLPKAQGFASAIRGDESPNVKTKTETISEMGYSRDEAKDYQTMAKNPEIVQRIIEDAVANGDVVTKTQVLREIKMAKEEAKKREAELEAQVEELKNRPPETVETIVERIPEDYEELKKTCRTAEKECLEIREKYRQKCKEAEDLTKLLERDKVIQDADRDVQAFTHSTYSYIRQYGGHVWAFEQFNSLSEPVREEFIKAIKALDAFSQQLIANIGGTLDEK